MQRGCPQRRLYSFYRLKIGGRWASPGARHLKKKKKSAYNAGDVGSIPGSGRAPWRRAYQPTSVFLPGESHRRMSPAGYSLRGHKGLDTTEATEQALRHFNK